ncbi:hypothetical protein GE09DRAFT_1209709 [Coniochaeta sp. 2T2.1]|nr:hypothetical protein GE09DRAFT_1209709 [Coniochaeta sp. 2T2.1]
MSAPNQVFAYGTYERYKRSQWNFTQWLKDTAERLALRSGTASDASGAVGEAAGASSDKSSTKKKGKEKERILLQDSNASSVASNPAKIHETWITQMENMVTTIVENAGPEDIPDEQINNLRAVVKLRKEAAKFYAGNETAKAQNASHQQIINVFAGVLRRLEDLRSRFRGNGQPPRGTVEKNHITNRFEPLRRPNGNPGSDGKTSSEGEGFTDNAGSTVNNNGPKDNRRLKQQTSKRASGPTSSSTVADDSSSAFVRNEWVDNFHFINKDNQPDPDNDSLDDDMFLYCFFEDFNNVRKYISARWQDYYNGGSVHLNALAVTTNAAFGLFSQMEEVLMAKMQKQRHAQLKYEDIINVLSPRIEAYSPQGDLNEGQQSDKTREDEKKKDWLGLLAYHGLRSFLNNTTPPGETEISRTLTERRPGEDCGIMTGQELQQLTEQLVNKYMLEATATRVLKRIKRPEPTSPKLPGKTYLLSWAEEVLDSKPLGLSEIFSMQLHIDIRVALGHKVGNVFTTMQATGRKVTQTMEKYKKNAKGDCASLSKSLNAWQDCCQKTLLKDMTLGGKNAIFKALDIDVQVPEFVLQKEDPVWAGLLDFGAKLISNDLGDRFASAVPLIEAATYLYCAAKASPIKDDIRLPSWPDMEIFMDTYTSDSVFKLGLLQSPATPFTILSNWEKMMATFVTPALPARSEAIARRERSYEIGIRTSFFNRYSWFGDRKHFNPSQSHLSKQSYLDQVTFRRLLKKDKLLSDANIKRAMEAARKRSAAGGRASEMRPRPGQDLDGEKSVLKPMKIDDEMELKLLDGGVLSLDYFKLWDESVRLLRKVNKAFAEEFSGKLSGVAGVPDCFVVLPMLVAEELRKRATEDPTESEILGRLVDTVKKFLEEELDLHVV